MSWHRVPHTAWLQFRHTHLQLTRVEGLLHNHAVDNTVVAVLQTSKRQYISICLCHLLAGIFLVSCGRIDVKLRRLLGILALEHYITVAPTDIERFLVVQFKGLIAHSNCSRTTYIKDTNLTASREIRSLQRIDSLQLQCLLHRHRTTDYHTVVH